MKKGKWFLKVFAVAVIGMLLLGFILMTLWNWLVPDLFNGPQITFWHALGLFVLSRILFGGGWKGGYAGKRCGGGHWKQSYFQKLSSMTPEERQRFKERMTEKWCSPRRRTDESGTNV